MYRELYQNLEAEYSQNNLLSQDPALGHMAIAGEALLRLEAPFPGRLGGQLVQGMDSDVSQVLSSLYGLSGWLG